MVLKTNGDKLKTEGNVINQIISPENDEQCSLKDFSYKKKRSHDVRNG